MSDTLTQAERFIQLGEGEANGPSIRMSKETAEKIVREEGIDEKDLRKLIDALRLQGYGVQDYVVRVRVEVETTVRAQSTDEAEGMVQDLSPHYIDWSDFEVQTFEPLWAEPTG